MLACERNTILFFQHLSSSLPSQREKKNQILEVPVSSVVIECRSFFSYKFYRIIQIARQKNTSFLFIASKSRELLKNTF